MIRKLIKLLWAVSAIGIIVWLGWRYLGQLDLILQVPWYILTMLSAGFLLMRGFQAEVFRAVLPQLGVSISYLRAFMLAMVISLVNLVLPRVGMGSPAIYLKKRYSLLYADFMALLLPTVLLQITCIGLIGLGCQLYLLVMGQWAFNYLLGGFFLASFLGSLAVLRFPIRFSSHWNNRITRFLGRISDSWIVLRRRRGLVAYMFLMQLLVLASQAMRLWLCFWAIGVSVPLPALILSSFLGHLAMLLGYTPGGLGFREAAIALGASMLGVNPELAVTAAVLDRGIIFGTALLFGSMSLFGLIHSMKELQNS